MTSNTPPPQQGKKHSNNLRRRPVTCPLSKQRGVEISSHKVLVESLPFDSNTSCVHTDDEIEHSKLPSRPPSLPNFPQHASCEYNDGDDDALNLDLNYSRTSAPSDVNAYNTEAVLVSRNMHQHKNTTLKSRTKRQTLLLAIIQRNSRILLFIIAAMTMLIGMVTMVTFHMMLSKVDTTNANPMIHSPVNGGRGSVLSTMEKKISSKSSFHGHGINYKSHEKLEYFTYTDPSNGDIVSAPLGTGLDDTNSAASGSNSIFSPSLHHEVFPRICLYGSKNPNLKGGVRYRKGALLQRDPMLSVMPGEEPSYSEQKLRMPYEQGDCVPMKEWQVDSKPTCNTIHEVDVLSESVATAVSRVSRHKMDVDGDMWKKKDGDEDANHYMKLAGIGWFRLAFELKLEYGMPPVILKTLRYEREFYDEFYDLHRRDAMAMERLTFSPYVLNVYGYCGQSAINEAAKDNIERVFMRIKNKPGYEWYKLKVAAAVATAVADVHEVDYGTSSSSSPELAKNVTLVHYDLNPRNVAIMPNGMPKLNDFNVAEFLRWNKVKNEPCGFKGRLHEPWWRAPEEMIMETDNDELSQHTPPMLNEKVDIYSLGNILFRILTGLAPRGKSISERVTIAREELKNHAKPHMKQTYLQSHDPRTMVLLDAMDKCYKAKPEDRMPARKVANILIDATRRIKEKELDEDI